MGLLLFRTAWVFVVLVAGLLIWLWAGVPGGFDWPEAARAAAFAVGLAVVIGAGIPSATGQLAEDAMQPSRRRLLWFGILITVGALLVMGFPAGRDGLTGRRSVSSQSKPAAILAVNDVYRIEGRVGPEGRREGGLARLATLRRELERSYDLLFLHAGDVISPSLLGNAYHGRQMIDVMNMLQGDTHIGRRDERMYVTFGNHEFDESDCERPDILRDRVAESDFYWLTSNIHFKQCPNNAPMITSGNVLSHAIIEIGNIKIGLFGLTIDLADARSQPPIDGERERERISAIETHQLRADGADLVVALTHLDYREDAKLLSQPGKAREGERSQIDRPDLIVGGHDHQRMVIEVEGRRVYKADADAATVSLLQLTRDASGGIKTSHRFITLDEYIPEDPQVSTRVTNWLERYDRQACTAVGQESGCLDKLVATSEVPLEGDEMKIRRGETMLGDVVADSMLRAVGWASRAAKASSSCEIDPDGSFINAGSLRLNADLPRGARVTWRTIEELLPFTTKVHLVRLSAVDILQLMAQALANQNSGGWLQISGMRVNQEEAGLPHVLVHRPREGPDVWIDLSKVSDRDAKQFYMVTTDWLLTGDGSHDGYNIDAQSMPCPEADFKAFLESDLAFPDHIIRVPTQIGRIVLRGSS